MKNDSDASNSTILVNGKRVQIKNNPRKLITLDDLEELTFLLLAKREKGVVTKENMRKSLLDFMVEFNRQLNKSPFEKIKVSADILMFVENLKDSGDSDILTSGLFSLKKRALGKNKLFLSIVIGEGLALILESKASNIEEAQGKDINRAINKYNEKTPDEQFEKAQYYSSREVKDFEEAIKWYESCKSSNCKCSFQLGIMTYLGVGMNSDKDAGLALIDGSINKGGNEHLLKVIKFIDSRIDLGSNSEEALSKLKEVKRNAFEKV